MHTTIEVISIEEIKSVLMRNEVSRLSIKISMNKHQLTTLILNSFDDFGIDELNEILKCEGININQLNKKNENRN